MGGPVRGGEIFVDGSEGGAAIRVIGRPGQGPGEFGTDPLQMMVVPGDTVHVNDRIAGGRYDAPLYPMCGGPLMLPSSLRVSAKPSHAPTAHAQERTPGQPAVPVP